MSRRKSTAERYFEAIAKGKVVACRKMKLLAEKMLPRFAEPYKDWHFDIDKAERPCEFIERFLCIPSGRLGVPFKLEPYERALIECAFGFVDDDGLRQFHEVMAVWGRKNGKALSLDTEIPTPDGWKTMADIHPGDYVFGCDGKPSRVLVESEVFEKPMYCVTFEDGSSIKASADHIWTVKTKRTVRDFREGHVRRDVHDGFWTERTTEEIASNFSHLRKDGKGIEFRYRVPMNAPVEYPERDLPFDPYVLGVWLGDGTATKTEVTCSDADRDEMMGLIASHGVECDWVKYPSNRAGVIKLTPTSRGHKNPTRDTLRELGVFDNKHIPTVYMQSGIEQRMELLRGLMDTDGFVSKAGQCEFSQKDKRFVEQVSELISSLGIKNSVHGKWTNCNGKRCKSYVVRFFTDKTRPCFNLKRKRDRLKDKLNDRMLSKSVTSVERIPVEPSKCIAIDNESHLYLAGRHFTPTHNTSMLAAIEMYMLLADGEGAPQIYNVATNEDQARLGYNAAVRMWRQSKKIQKRVKHTSENLYNSSNMGYIRPLTSNTRHLDGLDVHCAVIDELAAVDNRDLYDLVKQGMSARDQPMLFVITTNGFVRDNIFDAQYDYASRWLEGKITDDRFLPFIYELDDREEWLKEECWIKANPGLGKVKKLDKLRANVQKAKNDPMFRATVLTKDFNMPENNAVAWLSYDEAINEAEADIPSLGIRYGIAGFDAADTVDLAAAKVLCMVPGDDRIYERSMYWLPEEALMNSISGQKERDLVPYHKWVADGLMRTVPGNKVDKRVFIDWLEELRDTEDIYTYAIGYDPWHMEPVEADMQAFVGKSRCIPVRQGPATLSQPMKQIRADFAANRIVDNHNPINEWCRLNVSVTVDRNGNIQPYKKNSEARNRIDGFMAEICAYTVLCNLMDGYEQVI